MFKEAAEVAWAASYTSWGVVRAVRKPLASANDDGRAVYPRLREDDAAISSSPKNAGYDCPLRYPGQWDDCESGLEYNRHRAYDPDLGQYVSPDPSRLTGGVRLQAYVDNPLNQIDPSGLRSVSRFDTDSEAGGASPYAQWQNPDGTWAWPPNDGAVPGSVKNTTLLPGQTIDRYGHSGGKYTSPISVPYQQRSLKPGSHLNGYHKYKVLRPIAVQEGTVAPWFGEPGGGTQYLLPQSVENLTSGPDPSLGEIK